MKLSKEFKIGLIITAALALLYWGINFLKGEDIFSNEKVYLAIYKDVAGLEKANPVTINGLNVGQVRDMYFSSGGNANVTIEIVIRNEIGIPSNSVAEIISSDLLGSKALMIKLGNSPELAKSGDTLISEVEISIKEEIDKQLKPLKNKAEALMFSIDSVLTMLQSLFSVANTNNIAKSVEHIANSFENLEGATSTLDTLLGSQKNRLGNIVSNIESVTNNLKQNEDQFNHLMNNLSSFSDTLAAVKFAQTMNNVNETMKQMADITSKINQGEGTIGLLINNDSLYINLENTTRELDMLIRDLRTNPKKYVRFSVF
ncbi:MAG: MlaD family protein [Bacteroidales bacterium]|nr:MlaD family protein [Bacteroidales bacterium]MCF8405053.1 MlaD family protein [Bacteroidales bacterium]